MFGTRVTGRIIHGLRKKIVNVTILVLPTHNKLDPTHDHSPSKCRDEEVYPM